MRTSALILCLLAAQPACAQVTFVSPTDGSVHYQGSTLQVRVNCQNSSDLQQVELFVDGVSVGTNSAEPYRWTITTSNTNTWHTLRAVADYRSAPQAEDLIQIQVDGLAPPAPATPKITYIGVDMDVTDFQNGVDYGNAGYWFPMWNASSPRSDKPTDDRMYNALPIWADTMTHMEIWQLWKFPQRTFSQDGPTRSKGGDPSWNFFTLPNGEHGLSGIIFDPHGRNNTSQTVNRINLGPGTPSSFYLRIVVDNTDLRHNPINRIRARGDSNGTHIDPATYPQPGASAFNGIADVYTFRYDGFRDGDFIKIQFNGMDGSTNNGGPGGSSFAGLLFDIVPANPSTPAPAPAPTPVSPTPAPAPAPAPTRPGTTAPGTTAPGATAAPAPTGGGSSSSSGSCALSAERDSSVPGAPLLGLLALLLWTLRQRREAGLED